MRFHFVSLIQGGIVETSGACSDTFHYRSDDELVALVLRLIAEDFHFVDAPAGWPPTAVLEDLQECGLLIVPFFAITWRGPGEYETTLVPREQGKT
jgi:hypothetical protein